MHYEMKTCADIYDKISYDYTHLQSTRFWTKANISPMQNSVAATPIAIFIFSLYPVLPIAFLTRSKPSLKLQMQYSVSTISLKNIKQRCENLPWDVGSKTAIFTNITSMCTIYLCNNCLPCKHKQLTFSLFWLRYWVYWWHPVGYKKQYKNRINSYDKI